MRSDLPVVFPQYTHTHTRALTCTSYTQHEGLTIAFIIHKPPNSHTELLPSTMRERQIDHG